VLRYGNFSVVMSMSRRIALYTACNISGPTSKRIKRDLTHRYDDRIDRAHQAGNELYHDNELDRGISSVAKTRSGARGRRRQRRHIPFHQLLAAAQRMNQKTWLGLEDYILQNARVHKLRISVFTGPVLRDDDMVYRDVRSPRILESHRVSYRRSTVGDRLPDEPGQTHRGSRVRFGRYKTYAGGDRRGPGAGRARFRDLSRFDGFRTKRCSRASVASRGAPVVEAIRV
jgi:endonuclease G